MLILKELQCYNTTILIIRSIPSIFYKNDRLKTFWKDFPVTENFDYLFSFNLKRSAFDSYSKQSLSQVYLYEISGDSFLFDCHWIVQVRRRLKEKKKLCLS